MVFTNTAVLNIIDYLDGNAPTAPTHMGLGTSAVVADVSQTALGAELARYAIDTTTSGSSSITFTYVLPSITQNGESLTEFGVFNAASGSTMFTRTTHTALAKTSSIEVEYTVTINVGNT